MTPTPTPISARRPRRDALTQFLHAEAAGGLVLLAAVVVALVWANSPFDASYARVVGGAGWTNRRTWVNDGLMTLFFLVVSLEIVRELVLGELRDRRRAALPVIAALGGMVVPALLYTMLAAGTSYAHGWGIPMATDIAMAVGVLSLLGRRVRAEHKLFLLALAIVDDLGAIVVIAVFYARSLAPAALVVAAVLVVALVALRVARVAPVWPYVAVCAALWFALHEAGVHPTLAGVALAFALPAARLEHVEHVLHPLATFVVVPLFALCNAGVPLDGGLDRGSWAVVLGLSVGKPVGVLAAVLVTAALGLIARPRRADLAAFAGIGALAGIGFTVSIFVSRLAFDGDPARADAAMTGVFLASVVSAVVGSTILVLVARRSSRGGSDRRRDQVV